MATAIARIKTALFVINIIALILFVFFVSKGVSSGSETLAQEVPQNTNSINFPTRLVISDLGIDLPIYTTELVNGDWEEIDNGILYLSNSAIPGESGNSIIYGHNTPKLLGNLKNAQKDALIKIKYANGESKSFNITNTFNVTPDQTHILKTSKKPKITIFTCNGFFDEKRFVVVAIPTDA